MEQQEVKSFIQVFLNLLNSILIVMKNYKLIFFVPENAVEEVKQAIFATGAGSLGTYIQCARQTLAVLW